MSKSKKYIIKHTLDLNRFRHMGGILTPTNDKHKKKNKEIHDFEIQELKNKFLVAFEQELSTMNIPVKINHDPKTRDIVYSIECEFEIKFNKEN